jgi:hypothetical protein
MKLRIKGNSLRLRLTRSEVAKLLDVGHIEETIYFSPDEQSRLTYSLRVEPDLTSATLRYQRPEVVVVLPTKEATTWAQDNEVGMYATVDLGPRGTLDLVVEKDFACLDGNDADNLDTFENPSTTGICR